MSGNSQFIRLSKGLKEWITEDNRIAVYYNREKEVVMVDLLKDKYIFEVSNSEDNGFLLAMTTANGLVTDKKVNTNVKQLIDDMILFVRTGKVKHNTEVQDLQFPYKVNGVKMTTHMSTVRM